MIAFGCSITDPETYERCAGRGIELAREPDSLVFAHAATGSLLRNYNILLDQARELGDELEALVLVHQDSEIADPRFCATLREAIADPMVAIVGCVGSIGARNIAWWEGSVTWASLHPSLPRARVRRRRVPSVRLGLRGLARLRPHRRGRQPRRLLAGSHPVGDREPALRRVAGSAHGYDADLCLQAREAGRKVVTADVKVVHHHSLDLIGDPDAWMAAHVRVAEKWDGRVPMITEEAGNLEQRARRAEAEAGMLRLKVSATDLQAKAQARQLQREIGALRAIVSSVERSQSWRLTRPLRALGRRLRRR